MPSIIPSYRTNPGGSITYQDMPIGSSLGTAAPQGAIVTGVTYDECPTSRTIIMDMNALSVTVTKNGATCGFGGILLYTLPRGLTQLVGASANLEIVANPVGGLATGASVVSALGTVIATNADAALTSTEATWIASTASTLTAFAGAFSAVSSTTAAALSDDRTTARAVWLNFACPGADIAASTTVAVTGTVKFAFNAV